jgi:hypothetical protein
MSRHLSKPPDSLKTCSMAAPRARKASRQVFGVGQEPLASEGGGLSKHHETVDVRAACAPEHPGAQKFVGSHPDPVRIMDAMPDASWLRGEDTLGGSGAPGRRFSNELQGLDCDRSDGRHGGHSLALANGCDFSAPR